MGKALSVCKGKSEEPKKQGLFSSVQGSIFEKGNTRIPRVWYEPTESGGIYASQRDVGEQGYWHASDPNAEADEKEARLAEWHEEQLEAIEEIRAVTMRMEALRRAEQQRQEEERIAAERQAAEEARAKAKEAEIHKVESDRTMKAKAIAEAEEEEMKKERMTRQNGLKTTSISSNTKALETASEIARKWLTSPESNIDIESKEDEAIINTNGVSPQSGATEECTTTDVTPSFLFTSLSAYASSLSTKKLPVPLPTASFHPALSSPFEDHRYRGNTTMEASE